MKDITRKPLHRSFVRSFATSNTSTAAADNDAAGGDSAGEGANCCCLGDGLAVPVVFVL